MSKVYKFSGGNAAHEPFVMEDFTGGRRAHKEAGKVGGDVVAIEREAYEKGFASGEKAGFELGRQKAEVLFQGLGGVLEDLSGFREKLLKRCEGEVTELVLAIARKVIQRELELKEETVIDTVRAALAAVVASGRVVVKVNSKDMEVLSGHREELVRYSDGVKEMVLESDDTVSRGGCVIETNYGEVDATIDGIYSEIEERLRDDG